MSSSNPFNTSEARRYLDDLKKRLESFQSLVASKTNISINHWHSSFHAKQKKMFDTDSIPPLNAISARVLNVENALLNETVDFVKDHKSLVKEANENIEHIKVLERHNDILSEVALST